MFNLYGTLEKVFFNLFEILWTRKTEENVPLNLDTSMTFMEHNRIIKNTGRKLET